MPADFRFRPILCLAMYGILYYMICSAMVPRIVLGSVNLNTGHLLVYKLSGYHIHFKSYTKIFRVCLSSQQSF